MSEVEQLDSVRHADQILLHQWIVIANDAALSELPIERAFREDVSGSSKGYSSTKVTASTEISERRLMAP
jgi:hypothetical protein